MVPPVWENERTFSRSAVASVCAFGSDRSVADDPEKTQKKSVGRSSRMSGFFRRIKCIPTRHSSPSTAVQRNPSPSDFGSVAYRPQRTDSILRDSCSICGSTNVRKCCGMAVRTALMLDLLWFRDCSNSFRERLCFQVVETENLRMMVC